MRSVPSWRRYLTFWRADPARDVDTELEFHLAMRTAEYMARGLTEAEARHAAESRLGDVDAARTECVALGHLRESQTRRAHFFESLSADLRFAWRGLVRTPGWTAVALLTIALGVGATTTVFTVTDTLMVRPFPYPDGSRIYLARREHLNPDGGIATSMGIPSTVLTNWREHARSIVGATQVNSVDDSRLRLGSDVVTVHVAQIDSAFLAFAGARLIIGRNFIADEVRPGGPGAILLTEALWRSRYGASHDVLGSVASLLSADDDPGTPVQTKSYSIIGVVPSSVSIPIFGRARADVLLPRATNATGPVLVRLAPGMTPATATQDLGDILSHSANVPTLPDGTTLDLHLHRPQDTLSFRQPLVMLTAAVALLLLVAATNVTHLLLARGAARHRELAVRSALGARRSRLVRQLVTESMLLAVIGGALAVAVGWVGLRLLLVLRPPSLRALTFVVADHGVVVIASGLAIGCGLAVGLFAALRTARSDVASSLRSGGSSASVGGRRLRASLVMGQIAISATLLVGALLLIHTVFDLQRAPLGFDARGLYAISGESPDFKARFIERAAEIGAIGVTQGNVPWGGGSSGWVATAAFETPDRPGSPENSSGFVGLPRVSPDYFAILRMPFLAGHTFDAGSAARGEVIVSASVAHQIWPDGIAVGRRYHLFSDPTRCVARDQCTDWKTVIGVVPDVVFDRVRGGPANALIYRPGDGTLLVRVDGANALARIRQLATAVQPTGSRMLIENVGEEIDKSMAEPRFTMGILIAFAALGVTLAAIGLFGVVSHSVGQRTREIGVRMTLGATRGSIARLIVGDGIRVAAAGICLGLIGAAAATRLIAHALYGAARVDPLAFAGGAILLLVLSMIACITSPCGARRASIPRWSFGPSSGSGGLDCSSIPIELELHVELLPFITI